MLCSIKALDGFVLSALDGEIGHARGAYFDDERWVIRHVVVDTGGWLGGRDVLISPHAIRQVDRARHRLDVALHRKQIEDAPSIDTARPVSRQHEIALYDYYGYPYWWGGPGLWGVGGYPIAGVGLPYPMPEVPPIVAERAAAEHAAADPHLRSSAEVLGYHIEASDGGIGHVDDLLFDADSWAIRCAVVDTRNWLPGRLVLIPTRSIQTIDWNERRAYISLARDAVKESPPYEPSAVLRDESAQRLQRREDQSI